MLVRACLCYRAELDDERGPLLVDSLREALASDAIIELAVVAMLGWDGEALTPTAQAALDQVRFRLRRVSVA